MKVPKPPIFILLFVGSLFLVPCSLLLASSPKITSVFSPKSTVKIQSGNKESALREPMGVPNGPFTLTTDDGDMVEVQFNDDSFVRLAPHSRAEFIPEKNEVTLYLGTALVYFANHSPLHINSQLDLEGSDSLVLVTEDADGNRVLPLMGAPYFHSKPVEEGSIASVDAKGTVEDRGMIDLKHFEHTSRILVDLPGSPSLSNFLPDLTNLPDVPEAEKKGTQVELAQERINRFLGINSQDVPETNAIFSDRVAGLTVNNGATLNPAAAVRQFTGVALKPPPPH